MSKTSILEMCAAAIRECCRCGLCQNACPTFGLTHKEWDGPRGRLLMAGALLERRLQPHMAAEFFAGCLLCGRCQKSCPSGLPLDNIFAMAKYALAPWLHVGKMQKTLARSALFQPKILDFLQSPLALAQRYAPRKKGGAYFPALAVQPFFGKHRQVDTKKKLADVVLFTGCLTRRFYTGTVKAALDILYGNGYETLIPDQLSCCGRPLLMQGNESALARACRRNLKILQGLSFSRLVSPCPGCIATIREVWPKLPSLTADERQIAEKIADKSAHVIQLAQHVTDHFSEKASVFNKRQRLYWHSPCLLEDREAALHLLEECDHAEIVIGSEKCCGAPLKCSGGAPGTSSGIMANSASMDFLAGSAARNTSQFEKALPRALRDDILAAGVKGVVTACPGCQIAIRGAFLQYGDKLPVVDIMEFLAQMSEQDRRFL